MGKAEAPIYMLQQLSATETNWNFIAFLAITWVALASS